MNREGRDIQSRRIEELGKIKFDLLAQGAQITTDAEELLFGTGIHRGLGTPVLRTRSGVSGGLDVSLDTELGLYVNIPIREPFAEHSSYRLETRDGELILYGPSTSMPVSVIPEPGYYSERTADGSEKLSKIAQMCSGDRLCFGITGPGCSFWSRPKRCQYCSIGDNYNADAAHKLETHFVEVLERAMLDEVRPARHILIGGGTPRGDDMGAKASARLTRLVKERSDLPVYVMIAAPLEDVYIDDIFNAGADELGINIEFWSKDAWNSFIPGKSSVIGKTRYLKALEHASSLFGPERSRSIIIVGLEPSEETMKGVEFLCSIGVMPILSPFRPLAQTLLADKRGFSGTQYWELYKQCMDIATASNLVVGPTCIACQNNTLALPLGLPYRRY